MIEREIAERFLNNIVGVVRFDNGKQLFCRGKLIKVTDLCIVVEYFGSEQAISLDSIQNIREEKNVPRG